MLAFIGLLRVLVVGVALGRQEMMIFCLHQLEIASSELLQPKQVFLKKLLRARNRDSRLQGGGGGGGGHKCVGEYACKC